MSLYKSEANANGETVAVGANGLILFSDDGGATWETVPSGTANTLYGVAWGYAYEVERWVAVGQNGIILSSPDGRAWYTMTSFTGQTLTSVAYAGVFLAVGLAGVLGLSDDLGTTWEPKSSGTLEDLYNVSFDEGTYSIVGANDTFIVGETSVLEMECFVQDTVSTAGVETTTGTFQHDTTDTFEAVSGYNWQSGAESGGDVQYVPVVDGVGAYDYGTEPIGTFQQVMVEAVDLLHDFIGNAVYLRAIAEVGTFTGNAADEKRITRTLTELLTTSEVVSAALAVALVEQLTLIMAVGGGASFSRSVSESLEARDVALLAWLALVTDAVAATATASGKFEIAELLVDRLLLTGAAASRLQAVGAVSVALLFLDMVEGGLGAGAVESMVITPALVDQFNAYCVALDAATLTADAGAVLRLTMPLTDAVSAAAALSSAAVFRDLLADGVTFELLFNAGGTTYTGWVMNTRNFGVTEYQNYPFNSFAKIGNIYLGANPQGLYQLVGDTDAGDLVESRLTLGITDFGSDKLKRLDSIYLGFRANGNIVLKVLTESNAEYWYEAEVNKDTFHQNRVKMSKAVEAVTWQLSLQNIDGADFEIRSVEFVPVILSRRT